MTKPVEAATAPASTAAETTPDTAAEPEPAPGTEVDAALDVVVGPVKADEGTLGIGKLGAPKDKYTACVQKNGGLSGKTGEVSVRFLVRAKGVAEPQQGSRAMRGRSRRSPPRGHPRVGDGRRDGAGEVYETR
jgi:hypothetical protein